MEIDVYGCEGVAGGPALPPPPPAPPPPPPPPALPPPPPAPPVDLHGGGYETPPPRSTAHTAVVTDIGSSIARYSTYQVAVAFDARYTRDVYALFGSYDHALQIPPAYQVPTPFGTNVGPVNPAFFAVVRL